MDRLVAALLVTLVLLPAASGAQQSARRDEPARVAAAAPPQQRVGIEVSLPATLKPAPPGPIVRTANVIADPDVKTLLDNGFPVNLHYQADLWSRGGWFDDVEATVEWDVVVRYEPMTRTYRVARRVGERTENLGRFEHYADAQAAVARPFQPPIPARRSRSRQYYNVVLEIEVLSMNDLDELERWLRGELRPAVRGKRNPATALGRGLSTLATRLLGGETRRYEQRTETFRVER